MVLSLFYASIKKGCYVAFIILRLFYASPKKRCYVDFMLPSLFFLLKRIIVMFMVSTEV